jgi:hypothetical protein
LTVERGYPQFQDDMVQLNPRSSLHLDPLAREYHVGAYPVIERWLQVRRGRALSAAELRHVAALSAIAAATREIACDIEAIMKQ